MNILFSFIFITNIFIFKESIALEKNRNEKPNFVFILVDDLAFDAIQSSNRYAFLKTPNIQKLQDEGVTFSNFFCTTSICSPSRASFLTGVYAHTHGVTQNNNAFIKMDPDWNVFKPYPLLLQEQGYETAFIGKLHLANLHGEKQIRPGFDYWLSFREQGVYFDPELNENGREFKTTGYMTDILTKYAKDWLTREKWHEKPFSICIWHKAIHAPFLPAPNDTNLYKGEKLPEPPFNTYAENFKGKPQWQKVRSNTELDYDTKIETLPRKTWDPYNKVVFKMLRTLNAVDESVGVIYEILEDMGELDNTVIIFSSDNGYFMGEHTFYDKRLAYESSMRIPMIIRYPGAVKAGTHIEQMCLNIDLAPTILDLAKVNIPAYIQGKSFLPLLKNEKQPWRDSFLYEYYLQDAHPKAGPDLIAVRTEKYKLVDNFLENDIDELYDLENDPGEMNNLIKNADYENIKEQLREKAGVLMEELKYNRDRDWWLRTIKNE